jgi:hypothetical protein
MIIALLMNSDLQPYLSLRFDLHPNLFDIWRETLPENQHGFAS